MFVQLRVETSGFLSYLHEPWGSVVVLAPPLHVSTHKGFLPNLPCSIWLCPSEDRVQRWHGSYSHGGPSGARFVGSGWKPEIWHLGGKMRGGSQWPQSQEIQPWRGVFLAPSSRHKRVSPSRVLS